MGTQERRSREKAQRRKTILKAAKQVFFKKGFLAATMDQIAEKAELSKGTLYLYFKNKEELYVSLLIDGLDLLSDAYDWAVRGVTGWEEKVRRIGWAYFEYSRQNTQYFHINFKFHHGEVTAGISDTLFEKCYNSGIACLSALTDAIQEGMEEGEIRKSDPLALSITLWGSLTGIILLHDGRDHRKLMHVPLKTLIDHSIEISIAGLKERKFEK